MKEKEKNKGYVLVKNNDGKDIEITENEANVNGQMISLTSRTK